MPEPRKFTLAEIRRNVREEITFLEETIAKYPAWKWPAEMLKLAHEFEALVKSGSCDLERAQDFTLRVQKHIREERLKGMDDVIWRAEAFEEILRSKGPS